MVNKPNEVWLPIIMAIPQPLYKSAPPEADPLRFFSTGGFHYSPASTVPQKESLHKTSVLRELRFSRLWSYLRGFGGGIGLRVICYRHFPSQPCRCLLVIRVPRASARELPSYTFRLIFGWYYVCIRTLSRTRSPPTHPSPRFRIRCAVVVCSP